MTDQRMVIMLQEIIDNNDSREALRQVVAQLRLAFNANDGIHPSPYTNYITALALALEETS